MTTSSEEKFERIIKDGFYKTLKPLGFKKKRNNFYLQRQELGQIINIQKSAYGTKREINFTINTGIFVSEFWQEFYNFHGKGIPDFPTEPECLIRKRIGNLRGKGDIWYYIKEQTDENKLIIEMQENLNKFVLPYFEKIKTIEQVFRLLDNEELHLQPLGKLILYAKFKKIDEARKEYELLLKDRNNPYFQETVKKYGKKSG